MKIQIVMLAPVKNKVLNSNSEFCSIPPVAELFQTRSEAVRELNLS